jgi:hypothetical protein
MVIELYAADGQLQLSANETGWCDVALLASSIRYELGADATDVVTNKLSAAMVDTLLGHSSGTIDGVDVQWVLSLAERHCSMYAADVPERRALYFQGEDGRLLGKLHLDGADRARWRELLTIRSN